MGETPTLHKTFHTLSETPINSYEAALKLRRSLTWHRPIDGNDKYDIVNMSILFYEIIEKKIRSLLLFLCFHRWFIVEIAYVLAFSSSLVPFHSLVRGSALDSGTHSMETMKRRVASEIPRPWDGLWLGGRVFDIFVVLAIFLHFPLDCLRAIVFCTPLCLTLTFEQWGALQSLAFKVE